MEASSQTKRTQQRLKLQEYKLKREQLDEEKVTLNHEEQIETCPVTLWEEDPQSLETPQGGREELHTQPWQLRTSLVSWSSPEAKHDQRKMIKPVRTSQASP